MITDTAGGRGRQTDRSGDRGRLVPSPDTWPAGRASQSAFAGKDGRTVGRKVKAVYHQRNFWVCRTRFADESAAASRDPLLDFQCSKPNDSDCTPATARHPSSTARSSKTSFAVRYGLSACRMPASRGRSGRKVEPRRSCSSRDWPKRYARNRRKPFVTGGASEPIASGSGARRYWRADAGLQGTMSGCGRYGPPRSQRKLDGRSRLFGRGGGISVCLTAVPDGSCRCRFPDGGLPKRMPRFVNCRLVEPSSNSVAHCVRFLRGGAGWECRMGG
jgi:hypothetical protein